MRPETIIDAVAVAIAAHGDQRYGNQPYIAHPIAVADQVGTRGGTDTQIIAAILHDAVEDTELTIQQVRVMFGDEVARIVEALTHDPAVPYADYVAALPDGAVLVKLCDSICNLATLPDAPMSPARKLQLTDRYEANIATLSARLKALR